MVTGATWPFAAAEICRSCSEAVSCQRRAGPREREWQVVIATLEETLFKLISNWYTSTGYLGIVLAMALESCCIPLPSEIVMPLAGFFVATSAATATGRLSLIGVSIAGAVGCLLGSAVAYGIGASGGRPLLLKYGKYILISQADSDRADRWFAKYGSPVAFFSRLLPVIRTYISLPAGISRMNFTKFMIYTLLGSLPWTFALAYVGYAFGPALQRKISSLSSIFHGLDIVIIALVVLAVAFYVYRHLQHDRQQTQAATASPSSQTSPASHGAQSVHYPRASQAAQAPQSPQSPQAPNWQQQQQPQWEPPQEAQWPQRAPQQQQYPQLPQQPQPPRSPWPAECGSSADRVDQPSMPLRTL